MEKFGRVCKEYMVKEIVALFKDYPNFFIATFSKIGVGDTERLRKDLKRHSSLYMVVKNALLKRAVKESGRDIGILKEAEPFISGSCGILFSKSDAVAISRTLANFAKEFENFKIQCGFVDGQVITSDTIKLLASLPSREVLLGMVASGINAPISGFVCLLGGLMRNLIGAIDAISKKRSEA